MTRAPATAATRPGTILLIEDTTSLQIVYRMVLEDAGHTVHLADTAADGMALFRDVEFDLVLLDLILPDRDGLDLMQEMLVLRPDTRIIVITANGSINKAVEAMRAGATEFLVKPFDDIRFLDAVRNAMAQGPGRTRLRAAPVQDRAVPGLPTQTTEATAGTFIGSSDTMTRIQSKIASVAKSMATVFITGESGTGKELCALAVHAGSNRANGPFIALNCGAIPQDLLESEVFGHVKGSFTGAISDKPGAAAAADGGTLFLDEICEMAPALQTKLLRFLQTSTVQPVGATKPRKVNVRIVCATNRDPLDAVRRGLFREDLYYRLFVVPIHMPPLRERERDVLEIATAALRHFSAEEGRAFRALDPEVTELFLRLPWPGNVRQLLNVIRNIVVLNDGQLVTMDMLPDDLAPTPVKWAGPTTVPAARPAELTSVGLVGKTLAEIEREVIEATLASCGGSVPKAARILDLAPSTLYRKMEGWNAPQKNLA
jgi:two-component system, repressor protein LuxO